MTWVVACGENYLIAFRPSSVVPMRTMQSSYIVSRSIIPVDSFPGSISRALGGRAVRSGGERRVVRKCGAFGLLAIDEWLLAKLDAEFRSMLLVLRELRSFWV